MHFISGVGDKFAGSPLLCKILFVYICAVDAQAMLLLLTHYLTCHITLVIPISQLTLDHVTCSHISLLQHIHRPNY